MIELGTTGCLITDNIIGRGDFSHVYEGYNKYNRDRLAVKVIDEGVLNEYVRREISALNKANHINIIRLKDVVYNQKLFGMSIVSTLLILEYAGKELYNILEETPQGMDEEVARRLFVQILNALASLHRMNLCHGNITTENICVSETNLVKLVDFVQAREMKDDAEYEMSSAYSREADIFAAGIVLFCLLFGHPPFQNATVDDPLYFALMQKNTDKFWRSHLKVEISASARDLLLKMLDTNCANRICLEGIFSHGWICEMFMISPLKALTDKCNWQNVGSACSRGDCIQQKVCPPVYNPSASVRCYTQVECDGNSEELFDCIVEILERIDCIYTPKRESSEIHVKYCCDDGVWIGFVIRMYRLTNSFDNNHLIQFRRLNGDMFLFRDIYDDLSSDLFDMLTSGAAEA